MKMSDSGDKKFLHEKVYWKYQETTWKLHIKERKTQVTLNIATTEKHQYVIFGTEFIQFIKFT